MSFTSTPIEIPTARFVLEPLRVDHAAEMVGVLADPALYSYTGGTPPSLDDLHRRYTAQVAGSGDAAETWLNWIARLSSTGEAAGFVQATVETAETSVAWTIGRAWQRNGYATEAAQGMATWLVANNAPPLVAWIHPEHVASQRVAQALGLVSTGEVDEDGEQRWMAEQQRH